jgi:TPR repeat protein
MNTDFLYIAIPILVSVMFFVIYRKYLDKTYLTQQQIDSSESIIDIVLGADAGDPDSMEKLAWCYRKGDRVPQSSSYARELMAKARKLRKQHSIVGDDY